MLAPDISHDAGKTLRKVPTKHAKQIARKIFELCENHFVHDSCLLKGYPAYRRADSGEYRIVYRFTATILYIMLVGKRNDDDIYKKLKRANP